MFTSYSKPVVCPSWCSGDHLTYDIPPGDLVKHSSSFGVPSDTFRQVGKDDARCEPIELDLCQLEGDDGEHSESYIWLDGRSITLDQARLLANHLVSAIEAATR